MTSNLNGFHRVSASLGRLPAVWLAACIFLPWNATAEGAEPGVSVQSVFLKLLDEADAPAREAGALTAVPVKVGQLVERNAVLAQIDDTLARLALVRAEVELSRARQRAANDLRVRIAEKRLEAAQIELTRGRESAARYPKSVSAAELDQLRLSFERSELELEQARFELAELQLDVEARENDVAVARFALERRQIVAPFTGIVIEQLRRPGEWVAPGDAVLRIVRLDRLRAEGVVSASRIDQRSVGRRVQVTVRRDSQEITAAGTLTFVSPEVEPVTDRVRVWAEIDNSNQRLRPGAAAEMSIEP